MGLSCRHAGIMIHRRRLEAAAAASVFCGFSQWSRPLCHHLCRKYINKEKEDEHQRSVWHFSDQKKKKNSNKAEEEWTRLSNRRWSLSAGNGVLIVPPGGCHRWLMWRPSCDEMSKGQSVASQLGEPPSQVGLLLQRSQGQLQSRTPLGWEGNCTFSDTTHSRNA